MALTHQYTNAFMPRASQAMCSQCNVTRVYVRTWRVDEGQKWKLNDYLAVIGFLPFIAASVLGALSVHYGVGATDSYLDRYEMKNFITVRGMEYLLLYELTYYGSSTITKFAIAITILYICVEKRYKYLMYGIMTIMALTSGICLVWLFVNCVPFAAYWNPALGHCKAEDGFLNLSYVGTSVQVASDWACAITPFFVVYSLQMTRRSKVAVVAVLGLGVLASVAALMRIISYKYIDTKKYPKNHMVSQGPLLLWSILESSLALIACSLPSLKLFGGCLARPMSRSKGTPGSRTPYSHDTPLHPLTPHDQTRTTVSGKGNWDRLHDDDSSARHIITESEVHIASQSNIYTQESHKSTDNV